MIWQSEDNESIQAVFLELGKALDIKKEAKQS